MLSVIGLIVCSCAHHPDPFTKIVSEWQGREFLLPESMVDFLTDNAIDLSETDFTILTFVDSAGCVGCQMRLPLWNEFLLSLDSLASNVNFNALLVTSANSRMTSARHSLSPISRLSATMKPIH